MNSSEFYEWSGGASEEELDEMVETVKKRYHLFLLISLIPIVNWVTMGLCIFCYNNLAILKSRGRNTGNGLWRLILLVYGLIIFPLLIIQLCAKIDSLGNKVLGF